MCPALLCSRSRFFAMFIYVYTHWPEQHLFVHSFRETNLQKKKKRAISLSTCFSVLCSLAGREKALSFLYVLLLAIICELLDLAQMNHGEAQQFLMYVQQLLFWRCIVCSLVRKSTVC